MSRGLHIVMAFAIAWPASAARAEETPAETPQAERLKGLRELKGKETRGYVAFTFDDGPDHGTTPPILDLLDEHGLRAAFFLVGRRISGKSKNAVANRAVLARILGAGHLIGNHTFNHTNLEQTPLDEGIADVDKNQRAIKKATGREPGLFRAPFGRMTAEVRKKLRARKYAIVGWSIDSQDFRTKQVEAIRKRVIDKILENDGGVVLLHDTHARTGEAFRLILADLQAANCARIDAGQDPIVPAELDWFATDADGAAIPVPDDVRARTEATRARILATCATASGAVDKNTPND